MRQITRTAETLEDRDMPTNLAEPDLVQALVDDVGRLSLRLIRQPVSGPILIVEVQFNVLETRKIRSVLGKGAVNEINR